MKQLSFDEIKEILQGKTVGIAGAGGLGSNCAVALARVGIGKIIIADFDVIVESNLNRQYFFHDQLGQKKVLAIKSNIQRINPSVVVDARVIKLTPENIPQIFAGCDVIVEAFDLADQKQMIIETVMEVFPDKPIISGVGLAGYGNNQSLKTQKIDNLYICGDQEKETSDTLPPLAPRVGIVANMQANLVLEILLNK
jgi:sulfur carrier protein ThiS adenylyltransferase